MFSPIKEMVSIDHEKIWELLAVRRVIDSEAAKMAVENATREQLKNFKKFIKTANRIGRKNMMESKEGGRFYRDFFQDITNMTNNTIYAHVTKTITTLLRGVLPYSRDKLKQIDNSSEIFYNQFLKIIKNIIEKNPEGARDAIIEHIDWLEESLKKVLG